MDQTFHRRYLSAQSRQMCHVGLKTLSPFPKVPKWMKLYSAKIYALQSGNHSSGELIASEAPMRVTIRAANFELDASESTVSAVVAAHPVITA